MQSKCMTVDLLVKVRDAVKMHDWSWLECAKSDGIVRFQDPLACRRQFCRNSERSNPASILHKSIVGRYRPVRLADGPIMARYRFM